MYLCASEMGQRCSSASVQMLHHDSFISQLKIISFSDNEDTRFSRTANGYIVPVHVLYPCISRLSAIECICIYGAYISMHKSYK